MELASGLPLWPQLAVILGPYILPTDRTPRSGLLFPGVGRAGNVALLTDFRKALDAVAIEAGFREPVMDPVTGEQAKDPKGNLCWRGTITTKMCRHSYCAARLQTLYHGAPVSVYTVAQELGHGGDSLVRRVYGHLGQVRHRSETVEYRVEQHTDRLASGKQEGWRRDFCSACQTFLTHGLIGIT